MFDFLQHLLNGLQLGSIYALVALGYTMVYGIVKLINFAHGEIIMVGAYASLQVIPLLLQAGLPIWLCVFVSAIFCALLGVVLEEIAYRPLRNAPRLCSLITAIGMSLLLQNLAQMIFTSNPKPFPNVFPTKPFHIGAIQTSINTILTIGVSIVLMVLLHLYTKTTKSGRAMRCVSEDLGAARLMGINVNRTIMITFAIGSALAAVASVFYANTYPVVEPVMGSMMGLKAFIAAVLGGIGIIPGAMFGGILMGITEGMAKAYIDSRTADAIVFGILILVLLFKPSGLFGKNVKEKV